MQDPMDVLADAFRREWADPLASAVAVVSALRSLADSDWSNALPRIQRFRKERADSALLLAVTDPAVDPDIGRVLSGLEAVHPDRGAFAREGTRDSGTGPAMAAGDERAFARQIEVHDASVRNPVAGGAPAPGPGFLLRAPS